MIILLAFCQIVIAMAYFFIGWKVVKRLPVSKATKFFGILFFAGCAATHLDMLIHLLWVPTTYHSAGLQWHMLAIHVPQAIGAWGFAMNFFRDLDRERKITEQVIKYARDLT